MNWFKLTPHEKIRGGFITWTENFKYQNSYVNLTPWARLDRSIKFKWRIWIQVIPFMRWALGRPIRYEKRLYKVRTGYINISQLNPNRWFKDRDYATGR